MSPSATVTCTATGVENRAPVARMVWLKTPNTTASAPSTSSWLTVLSVWAVSHTDHSVVKYALTSSRRDRTPVHGTRSSPGTSQSTVSANNSATPLGSKRPSRLTSSSRVARVVSVVVVITRNASTTYDRCQETI